MLFVLGGLAFSFLVPALAGYIAFAIADRPGIAPGFTVGLVATTVSAGFIGGLVGGLLAGFAALWISRLPVPAWGRGLMPVVIIPLGATLFAGGIMVMLLGRPLAAATAGLEGWLNGLSGGSVLLLGAILGAMMAFDMGGPVNKAAYAFAAAGLAGATAANVVPLEIMAAVMAAGMVPPLALALATVVRPSLFSPAERENGKAAWLLGASFITEGAIPFAAADPLRVIPPIMLGSAVTGAIVMASGVTLRAPHGGIFVFFAIGGIADVPRRPRRRHGHRRRRRHGRQVDRPQAGRGRRRRLTGARRCPRPPDSWRAGVGAGSCPAPCSAPAAPPRPRSCRPRERDLPMPSTTVTVGSSVGLHARPAALISQAAAESGVHGDPGRARR